MNPRGYETWLVGNDFHFPFQDVAVTELWLRFSNALRPDKVVLLGDIFDFEQISHFRKDPDRIGRLGEELGTCHKFLSQVRKYNPKADIHVCEGNHERRLQKYIWQNAQQMKPLIDLPGMREVLTIPQAYRLKEIGARYWDYSHPLIYKGIFRFIHPEKSPRMHSAYEARAQLDAGGMSGITGHSHRLGSHFKSDLSSTYGFWENGCLCDLNPEYMIGKIVDWQHGFSAIYFKGNRFHAVQVPIVGEEFIFNGQEWKS